MTKFELDIAQQDNTLAVRLPAALASAAHLHTNQRVSIAVKQGCVVVTPIENARLMLEQRLLRFDPQSHGGEVMATSMRVADERCERPRR